MLGVESRDRDCADLSCRCFVEHEVIVTVADGYAVVDSDVDGVVAVAGRYGAVAAGGDGIVAVADGDGAVISEHGDRVVAVAERYVAEAVALVGALGVLADGYRIVAITGSNAAFDRQRLPGRGQQRVVAVTGDDGRVRVVPDGRGDHRIVAVAERQNGTGAIAPAVKRDVAVAECNMTAGIVGAPGIRIVAVADGYVASRIVAAASEGIGSIADGDMAVGVVRPALERVVAVAKGYLGVDIVVATLKRIVSVSDGYAGVDVPAAAENRKIAVAKIERLIGERICLRTARQCHRCSHFTLPACRSCLVIRNEARSPDRSPHAQKKSAPSSRPWVRQTKDTRRPAPQKSAICFSASKSS